MDGYVAVGTSPTASLYLVDAGGRSVNGLSRLEPLQPQALERLYLICKGLPLCVGAPKRAVHSRPARRPLRDGEGRPQDGIQPFGHAAILVIPRLVVDLLDARQFTIE